MAKIPQDSRRIQPEPSPGEADRVQESRDQENRAQQSRLANAASAEPISMPAVDDGQISSPARVPKARPQLKPPSRQSSGPAAAAPVRVIAPITPIRGERRRRSPGAMLLTLSFFGLLALATVAVFILLPRWVEGSSQGPELPTAEEVASPLADGAAEEPEIRDEPAGGPEAETVKEPTAAPAASTSFSEQPSPAPRRAGHRLAALLADAEDAAARRDWAAAEAAYGRALKKAPQHQQALAGLQKARAARARNAFDATMSEAMAAIDGGRWQEARLALAQALKIQGSPEATRQIEEAFARIEQSERLTKLEASARRAAELEKAEDWHGAAKAYAAMLEVDSLLNDARVGEEKAKERAALYDRLAAHLGAPGRLGDAAVLREASALLQESQSVENPGPELQKRTASLASLIAGYAEPIVAELRSDALTEVTIYHVGRLGSFERRELSLRPGAYTVLGSRPGYRDVRRQLVIEPGKTPAPLEIRCEERL